MKSEKRLFEEAKKRAFARAKEWQAVQKQDGKCNFLAIEKLFRKRAKYLGFEQKIIWARSPSDLKKKINNLDGHRFINDQLLYNKHFNPRRQIFYQLKNQLLDQFLDQLRGELLSWLGQYIWNWLCDHALFQFLRSLRPESPLYHQLWNHFWGKFDLAYPDCLYQALPEKTIKNCFEFILEAFKEGLGFVVFTEKTIILLPMPYYTFNEWGRLHNDRGPALKWQSGKKEYFFHGVKVPEKVILHPEQLTPEDIFKEKNTEVRTVILERIGPDRLLKFLSHRIVDETEEGVLYDITLLRNGIYFPNSPFKILKVKDPSLNEFYQFPYRFLIVPPHMVSVHQARAWTFRFDNPKDFHPEIET